LSEVSNVGDHRAGVDVVFLSVYIALTIVVYLLRAWRFQLLIGNKGALSKLYGVVSIHTLMINLLPFSSGEISYPLLLKYYGIFHRFMDGVPSIIVARFQDLFITVSILVGALIWVGGFSLLLRMITGTFMGAVALSILILAGGLLIYKRFGEETRVGHYVRQFVAEVKSSFKKISRTVWLESFLIALTSRLTSIIATSYLLQAAGVLLSLPIVFLICSLYVFLPLLPVNTLAGLGITEAFLLTFFISSGIDQGVATAASVHIHLLQLSIAALLGTIGAVLLQFLRYQKSRILF